MPHARTSLQRRDRVNYLMAMLIGLTLLAGSASSPAPIAAQTQADPPLDLAAMVLTPADLAAEGMDGFALLSGSTLGPDGLARELSNWDDQNLIETIQENIEATAGLPLGYQIGLRGSTDPDDPEGTPTRDVYASLFAFASDADAEAAFTLIAGVIDASGIVTAVDSDTTLGDESLFLRQDESDTAPLVIVIRAGRVLATVQVVDFSSDDAAPEPEPLTPEDLQPIAARLIDRIDAGLDGDTPGLGPRTLRLTDDEYGSLYELRSDQYLRLDGDDIPISFVPDEAAAARTAAAGDAIDAYELVQFIQLDATDGLDLPDRISWQNRLYRFEDDAAATAWLDTKIGQLEDGDDTFDTAVEELEVIDDVPSLGEQSAAFSYLASQDGNAPSRIVRTLVQLGDTVADTLLSVGNPEDPPIQAIAGLATVQAQCLETAGCPAPSAISDALAGRAPDAATTASTGPALDLPALTLTPADLAEVDLDGFGVSYGAMTFPDQIIPFTAEARDANEDDVRALLEDAGIQRRYDSYLYLPHDAGDPSSPADVLVVSYLLEFADADGSAAAFEFLEDESADDTTEDVDLSTDLGDESEATIAAGEDPETDDEFAQIDITFRTGNLNAGVAIVDWTGDEPDQDDAEDLAARLLERIAGAEGDDAPALSNQILRLTGGDVETLNDMYVLRASDAVPYYGESRRDTRNRERAAAGVDKTDGYHLSQVAVPGATGPEGDVWYQLDLWRFAGAAAASDWLAGTEARLEDNAAVADFAFDDDAPAFGDESLTFTTTMESENGDVEIRSVILRVDATVVLLDISGPETPSASAVADLAAAQAACFAPGGCPDPIAVPAGLETGNAA